MLPPTSLFLPFNAFCLASPPPAFFWLGALGCPWSDCLVADTLPVRATFLCRELFGGMPWPWTQLPSAGLQVSLLPALRLSPDVQVGF